MQMLAGNGYRHLTVSDGLPNNQVRQIIELPNGQMLVETEGNYSLYNGRRFVALTYDLDSVSSLPTFGCHDHLWMGDSLLWLKDYYSLYLFDTRHRRFVYDYDRYTNESLTPFLHNNGDSVNHVHVVNLEAQQTVFNQIVQGSLLEGEQLQAYQLDRQGGQWFGTLNSGIAYVPPQTQAVRQVQLTTDDFIRRMMAIDSHTMLMAGEHGIYEFDCTTERITRTLASGAIHCAEMNRDSRGRIWIATKQGIYCYDRGKLSVYDQSNTTGFIHDHMRFALPLDESRLLVCNIMHHLGIFYPDERRMEMLNDRLPELDSYRVMVSATLLGNRNKVAVCTQNGLFVLDIVKKTLEKLPNLQSVDRYSHKYNCILLARDGRLWVGTQNGLLVLTDSTAHRVARNEGLSNECIQSLAEDPSGCIWVGTSNGVNRLRLDASSQKFGVRIIGTDNGMPEVETTERGICVMPDSTLYLATPVGIITLPTQDFVAPAEPLTVTIVGLSVAGTAMPLDTLTLYLNHRQNYIDFQVSALNYAAPHATRYRYRLIGADDEWHNPLEDDGRLAVIRLSALSPGSYTLEVEASTGDDRWGPTMRKSFVIAPPLWLTWWAKLLYVLLALAAAFALMRWYVLNRQQRMQAENEQRINELFELREEARHQFAQSVEIDPERIAVTSEEQRLIERMMKAIGDNISNTDYTVDLLAQDIGMSRANLYKKMQTMLGVTPNDFMRNVRLKRAAELLANSDLPVNQLSLMVGFQTPRYFSQCFRKMFGVTPSEYREGKK